MANGILVSNATAAGKTTWVLAGDRSARWFKQLYSTPAKDLPFWTPPVADPGSPAFLFNGTVYYRGAMTLQALREKIGDTPFFRLLRDWATQNRHGNVTTAQCIALAEQEAAWTSSTSSTSGSTSPTSPPRGSAAAAGGERVSPEL